MDEPGDCRPLPDIDVGVFGKLSVVHALLLLAASGDPGVQDNERAIGGALDDREGVN